eukprot:CAMPEP_0203687160 /NCGR_PEP_ID=MMETSP0091-20130426/167_1 /ASSEMBLY_ACC=CAM_ASM_001089 /TAXON_ID=426623 /ORGANISM="Chaetoceros affinis, Strain CCMP159" /LENGTH=52 /DNA_ID=CAMNT_0050556435 /DNA_START=122 /DNA_END=277 /DNA_ORIENTATION=-
MTSALSFALSVPTSWSATTSATWAVVSFALSVLALAFSVLALTLAFTRAPPV